MFEIEENLKTLPDKPGVYLHKDEYGEVIYIGKASSLKNRVRQYFRGGNHDRKVVAMVSHIAEFEYIVTKTEMEALLLENTLIKKYMPRYNVMLRDDKTYPYIKVSLNEHWPRIQKTRILKNDGSKYFGPYADVGAVNRIVEFLSDIYRLKRCNNRSFPEGFRACLNGHIGRCRQMCTEPVDREEYEADIRSIMEFLSGQSSKVVAHLKAEMELASSEMRFEDASRFRDYLSAAKSITEKQRVELLSSGNMDIVISTEVNESKIAQITVFFVRDGRLSGRELHHLDACADASKEEIVAAFLSQYYMNQTVIPREILLEGHVDGEDLIEKMLSENMGKSVRLHVPERGKKKALLSLALGDVLESTRIMADRIKSEQEREEALGNEIRDLLSISRGKGERIRLEAYDISNTGGEDSVGGMVVFQGNKPDRSGYRRFKIRGETKGDDYGSMQEVLYRRIKRGMEQSPGFEKMPDLILIDGGLGHVHAAEEVLNAMKVDIQVAGMVKDDKHRTRGLVRRGEELDLKEHPKLFALIGSIQEEVHRFAISYHRGVRKREAMRSELEEISGIGEKRRNALLLAFGSMDGIRAADEAELAAVPGMNLASARAVRAYFHRE